MIFAILTNPLNATSVNNDCVRTEARRFCLDTAIKGLEPLAQVGTFLGFMKASAPHHANGVGPTSFTCLSSR